MYRFALILLMLLLASCRPPNQNPGVALTSEDSDAMRFLVSLPREVWEAQYPELEGETVLFQTNQDGSQLEPLFTGLGNYTFVEEVGPNGSVLVSAFALNIPDGQIFGQLYLANLSGDMPVRLTNGYQNIRGFPKAAIWLPDRNEFAYIAREGQIPLVYVASLNGQQVSSLVDPNRLPSAFPPLYFAEYTESSILYWQEGFLNYPELGLTQGLTLFEFDSETFKRFFSQDGESFQLSVNPAGTLILAYDGNEQWLLAPDGELQGRAPIFGIAQVISWSPNGRFLLMSTVREIEGQDKFSLYLWEVGTPQPTEIPVNFRLSEAKWEPNGRLIVLIGHPFAEDDNSVDVALLNLNSLTQEPMFENLNLENLAHFDFELEWLNE